MKFTSIYVRSSLISRTKQQVQTCREFAEGKGLMFREPRVFVDRNGRSDDPDDERPAFRELLAAVRSGDCELLICESLIVLTPDMWEFAELWELATSGALRIVTVDGVDANFAGTGRSNTPSAQLTRSAK